MSSSSHTHPSLLIQMRDNEEVGWTRLVLLYTPLVTAWGNRLGCSREGCEDLCQEVFGAAALRIDSFQADGKTGSFRGWLWKITYRKWVDRYRQDKRQMLARGGSAAADELCNLVDPIWRESQEHANGANEPAGVTLEQELSSPEMLDALLQRALTIVKHETKPTHWDVFWLSAVDGLSTETIVSKMNLTSSNVRQIRSRVLRRLRIVLGDVKE